MTPMYNGEIKAIAEEIGSWWTTPPAGVYVEVEHDGWEVITFFVRVFEGRNGLGSVPEEGEFEIIFEGDIVGLDLMGELWCELSIADPKFLDNLRSKTEEFVEGKTKWI